MNTQKRNRFFLPALFLVMGATSILFAFRDKSWLNLSSAMGGGFILFGVVLAVLSQRYAKDMERDAQRAVAPDRPQAGSS